jgi:hypothetical protein
MRVLVGTAHEQAGLLRRPGKSLARSGAEFWSRSFVESKGEEKGHGRIVLGKGWRLEKDFGTFLKRGEDS